MWRVTGGISWPAGGDAGSMRIIKETNVGMVGSFRK